MTDFVLDIQNWINDKNKQDDSLFANRCVKYANFLQIPLKLEMFVPCDNEGDVLKEPKVRCDGGYDIDEVEQYQKAKEKVLFEDFHLLSFNPVDKSYYLANTDKRITVWIEPNDNIEDMIEYNLQLTQNAIKRLGL